MNQAQRDGLVAILKTASGIENLAWSKRPAVGQSKVKKLPRPYLGLLVITDTAIQTSGRMGELEGPNEDLLEMTAVCETVLTVTAYADRDHDARAAVQELHDYLKTPLGRRALKAVELTFVRKEGPIRDNAAFQSTHWEGRAELDFRLRYRRDWTVDAGVIEKATFTGAGSSTTADAQEDP